MPFTLDKGWLSPARHCESPHQDDRPEGEISLLVVHCISLPPGRFGGAFIDDLFLGRLNANAHSYFEGIHQLRVSAHCLIRRGGELVQYVPFHRRAWHAGQSCFEGRDKCNDFSIGIELEGTDSGDYTDVQYRQLAAVAQTLMGAYPAITPSRMTGHSDIAPGRKTDPGPGFDWDRFRRMLKT